MKFSILIPTYTGQEHIDKCFKSILDQEGIKNFEFEVVVVIDGPNDQLAERVRKAEQLSKKKKIRFSAKQLPKNKGRFDARLTCANMAQYDQLLFVDDRVVLNKDFFNELSKIKDLCAIPNVLEASHPNSVSRLNFLLRRKIYGRKNWGEGFKSFYIDGKNFEKASKGTTSLWIPKKEFINVCKEIRKNEGNKGNRFKNDDTKLLGLIVKNGNKILRSSTLKIYYNPRSKTIDELTHLYHRGPTFVDYYFRPGTRYWNIFPLGLAAMLVLTLFLILFGISVIYIFLFIALLLLTIAALALSQKPSDFLVVFIFLPLSVMFFGLGVLKGLIIKLKS